MAFDFWRKEAGYSIKPSDIEILPSARAYKETLLSLIRNATKRIVITALYLQDDDAGQEILEALHQASLLKPELSITILVDYHRAQRGLIGEKQSDGNAGFYYDYAQKFNSNVTVFGVPVKAKELFGVLHLKGFIFDDTVLYSGASLNNVYLHHHEKYRLDRYFLIKSSALSDAFYQFTDQILLTSAAVPRLDVKPVQKLAEVKNSHKRLMKTLRSAHYAKAQSESENSIEARLFLGFGRRGNKLNKLIKNLFELSESEMVLYTPYFNFPAPLLRVLRKKLKKGVNITIVVGDKTANDFYISPDKPFSKIGALPYLYETILYKFLKAKDTYVKSGQLKVYLWKHESNSFHLKGINVDNRYQLMTGHNLNPRAWGLDIENGILFDDPEQTLKPLLDKELQQILANSTLLTGYEQLETVEQYPDPVRKLLSQAKRVKVDFIIKKFI